MVFDARFVFDFLGFFNIKLVLKIFFFTVLISDLDSLTGHAFPGKVDS